MNKHTPDVNELVAEARKQGFFDPNKYAGLRLSLEELGELQQRLQKHRIPYGRPQIEVEPARKLSVPEARRVIGTLRLGIPAADYAECYSVGRETLMSRVGEELSTVTQRQSLVRFLNADIGQGKTHVLYLLRELAFRHKFAVSIVTLSQSSCPLYDFMAVYHDIMWGLRTADQRQEPALSNIIDRWIRDITVHDKHRVRDIVCNELPPALRGIMAAYVDATNLLRPDETKRQLILKYLGGDKMLAGDVRSLGIDFRLDNQNALQILSEVAATIRYIGFKGICILFDEAEAIHSFAYSAHRDQAYANLHHIIRKSQHFPNCYFVYATTPSFFGSGSSASLLDETGRQGLLELEPLCKEDKAAIGRKVVEIYQAAMEFQVPLKVTGAIDKAATSDGRIGEYIRQVIAIMDETRHRHG